MPALILHPNGTIGFVSDGGELDPISDINEVNALVASGIVGKDPVKLPNPQIWDLLNTRTSRLRAKNNPPVTVDFAPVLAAIKAIPASSGGPADLSPVIAAIKALTLKAQ